MTSTASTSTPSATNTGALRHVRVLDLSRVLAGPWCTQTLADMGADVIKIEKPGEGDDTRHWGPPFLQDEQGQSTDQASYYGACNRNKRSVTIDIATPEGQELVRQIALQSDVLVENFKTGGLKRYGLDYETLSALNPRLIYCSVTGFGHTGPYAERAGYDLMVQAMCGLMSITGHADGQPGGGPIRVGVAVTDIFTGLYSAIAILTALEARHSTGLGQHLDMALLDVGMAVLANQATGFLNTGAVPQRQGNTHPSVVPYQDFPTEDGSVLLAIGNDGQFARFCHAAGKSEWAQDERFITNSGRVQHRQTLIPLISELTRSRTTAAWIALLEDKAVPCGPINHIGQAFEDPQVKARGLSVSLPRWADGQAPDGIQHITSVASPLRLSANPAVLRNAAPALGQHTEEFLKSLNLSDERIEDLRTRGVI